MPRFSVPAATLALLVAGACTDTPTLVLPTADVGARDAMALSSPLQPTASPTATAAQFRWLEPVGAGGNALGHSDNRPAYLPFLRVELCEIPSAGAPCGPVVPGSVATAGDGLTLSAGGKAFAAILRARQLPLDPAQDYRLRVLLVDPAHPDQPAVQVGYQDVDVTGNGRDTPRAGFYQVTLRQSVPVKFILGPGIVRALTVSPAVDTIAVGATRPYSAAAVDWEGQPVEDLTPTWLTADPAIATVGPDGVLAAAAIGSTTLYATVDGVSAAQAIRVTSPVVTVTLAQSPANPVAAGTVVTLTATARDAAGNVVTNRPFAWSGATGAGSTATLTPAAAGSFPVSVSVDGISATLTVTAEAVVTGDPVAAIGLGAAVVTLNVGDQPSAPINATLWDERGVPLQGRPVSWSSGNPAVITVDGGYLRAIAPGYAYVTATSEGKSARLVAIVTPVGGGVGHTVGSIVVLPPEATITAPDTVRLVAVVLDVNGSPMANQQIGWTKGNNAVTLDDPHGETVLVTGVPSATQQSYVNVTAMVPVSDPRGSVNGVAQVIVLSPAAPPAPTNGTILISPDPVNAMVGETVTLTADVRDERGQPLPGLPLVWTIGNAQVATVSGSGYAVTLSALGAGLTSVRATSGALTGTATVTVTGNPPPPPPVTSLAVSPASATISQSSCVQLTATWTADGVPSDVTAQAGWQRGSDKVQPITNGLVCGAGNITNGRNAVVNVTVSYLGLQQTATITVTP